MDRGRFAPAAKSTRSKSSYAALVSFRSVGRNVQRLSLKKQKGKASLITSVGLQEYTDLSSWAHFVGCVPHPSSMVNAVNTLACLKPPLACVSWRQTPSGASRGGSATGGEAGRPAAGSLGGSLQASIMKLVSPMTEHELIKKHLPEIQEGLAHCKNWADSFELVGPLPSVNPTTS